MSAFELSHRGLWCLATALYLLFRSPRLLMARDIPIGLAERKKPRQAGCLLGLLRGAVQSNLQKCLLHYAGRHGRTQLLSASSARAVISSTLPVPLMARYLGACDGSLLAQLL